MLTNFIVKMDNELEQYIIAKKKESKNAFISGFVMLSVGAFMVYIDWPILGYIILVLGIFSFLGSLLFKNEATEEFYFKSKEKEKAALEVELRKKESLKLFDEAQAQMIPQEEEDEEEEDMVFIGNVKQIELWEESIVIGPTGDTWGKFMAASGTTSVNIYYSDIRSVIVQQQNVVGALFSRNISDIGKTLPYIRILIKGTESYSNGDFSPVNDPYTVTFTADKLGQAEYFKLQIDNLVSKHRQSADRNSVINQISSADELEKFANLLQKGIITQEEFELKKKQILGL